MLAALTGHRVAEIDHETDLLGDGAAIGAAALADTLIDADAGCHDENLNERAAGEARSSVRVSLATGRRGGEWASPASPAST